MVYAHKGTCEDAVHNNKIGGPFIPCMQFNHFAAILAAIVGLVTAMASLATSPPAKEKVNRVLFRV